MNDLVKPMPAITRRKAIASLGIFGASTALAGCDATEGKHFSARANVEKLNADGKPSHVRQWSYVNLDSEAVAADAYRIYPDGGCMYAVFGSVIRALAKRVGEPFISFPFEMMRYGDGGVGGWGSLCGVVNGAAALIGLFQNEISKTRRENLAAELCFWYERTALPQFQPAKAEWADEAEPSIADSILCHVSVSRWCKATGCEASGMEKKERCRRLSADGAKKIVEILNANLSGLLPNTMLLPEVKTCADCHGPMELNDTHGKMDCRSCHEFSAPHPSLMRE